MKSVRMSLISKTGKIVNEWSVPYFRREAALDHAMDRAEQEGHAGVIWAVINNNRIHEIAFDSFNPKHIYIFANVIQQHFAEMKRVAAHRV